jgi:small neutral amino acid transporter SnatA (MarC family)
MFRVSFFAVVLLLAVIVGGGVFLATWDIPAPSERVIKTLPDDRFPR